MNTVKDLDNKIKIIASAVSDITKLNVIATGVYGSMMRGYPDPNQVIDACILVQRPVSEYLGFTESLYFPNGRRDAWEYRTEFMKLSSAVSKQTGIEAMISIVDTRDLLIGIMTNTPFSLCAYEEFCKNNTFVQELYGQAAEFYNNTVNKVGKTGANIRKAIVSYTTQLRAGSEHNTFKLERTYLSILWYCHRLLAYIGGDTTNVRTIKELVAFNKEKWEKVIPALFSNDILYVWKARIGRTHFDLAEPIEKESGDLLLLTANEVLKTASTFMSNNSDKPLSSQDQTIELIEFYQHLLDKEEQKNT